MGFEQPSEMIFNPVFTVDVLVNLCRDKEPKLSAHVAYDRDGLLGVPYVEIVCNLQPIIVAFSVETGCFASLPGPLVKCWLGDLGGGLSRRSVSEKFVSGLRRREAK
jgi:hypothetical protein